MLKDEEHEKSTATKQTIAWMQAVAKPKEAGDG
jgi:hypothetical protein